MCRRPKDSQSHWCILLYYSFHIRSKDRLIGLISKFPQYINKFQLIWDRKSKMAKLLLWYQPWLWIVMHCSFPGLSPGGGIEWSQLGRSKWPLVAALGAGCLVGASGLFLVQVWIYIYLPISSLINNVDFYFSASLGVWSWKHRLGLCPKSSRNSTSLSAVCRDGKQDHVI